MSAPTIKAPTSVQTRILKTFYPKDPAVLKIVRVVNSLRVVFLVPQGDLLSRRTLCGHQLTVSWELQTFSLSKKSLRRSKFGGRSSVQTRILKTF